MVKPPVKIKAIRGRKYRSKFESSIAKNLGNRRIPFEYESMEIPYTIERIYNPDFILENGIIIEAKGYLTAADRQKAIAVQKQNPELDIRFMFQRASNRLSRKSATTYGDWATAKGFKWCDGQKIPLKWTKE